MSLRVADPVASVLLTVILGVGILGSCMHVARAQEALRAVTPSTSEFALPGDWPLPLAKPEQAAMSSERLGEIDRTLEADIEAGRLPGAVLVIARRNKLIYFKAFGYRDASNNVAMTTDTIFNIASMTKPLTAVAALQLYEKGRILMDDPVSKYFPKFADMRVAVLDADDARIIDTVPANRQITIMDLLRHTSGLIYGARGTTAVHKLYPSGSTAAAETMSGAQFLDQLSSRPLLHQPGAVWDYGFGLDVLGLVVESVIGQSLGRYLQEHVFAPLRMTDTGFFIPAAKAARYAQALPTDPLTGEPQSLRPVLTQPLQFECGGGCAASTAADYLRFALMLLQKGRFGEDQILGRKTVEYMLANQLGPEVTNLIGNADPTRADYGFGLGLAVRTTLGIVRMMGSVGEFSWPGASGTNWWADPREELAVVFMAHTPGPLRWHYRQLINALVYQAIVD